MTDRFFHATVLGGRLHVNGIPEWGPWDPKRFDWWSEQEVDLILSTTGARKIRTDDELEAVIKTPTGVAPTKGLWIPESLMDRRAG